jgi:hypothetical protein
LLLLLVRLLPLLRGCGCVPAHSLAEQCALVGLVCVKVLNSSNRVPRLQVQQQAAITACYMTGMPASTPAAVCRRSW